MSKQEAKISVIIPVYKVEKYLDKCVESVINQTYKNLEIILVDDGSPDACPKMCDDWAKKDKRIKVIHKQNGGVSSTRNIGLKNATGDYIAFVDADDYIEKEMYEKLINAINENKADLAFCYFNNVYEDSGAIKKVYEKNLKTLGENLSFDYFLKVGSKNNKDYLETENIMGNVWRILFARELLENVSFNENLTICEDLIFVTEVLKKKPKVCVVEDYLYNYVQRNTSAMHNLSIKKVNSHINACRILVELYKPLVENNVLNAYKFSVYKSLVSEVLILGSKKELKELVENEYFSSLRNKNNYVAAKNSCATKKAKLVNFLVYHKWFCLYKSLYKLTKH